MKQLRVEPEPDLLAHLRDPVGREPLLPGRVVGQVGGRQALRRTGRVPLGDVLGLSQPSVENGTMPASSQTSPTSSIRCTASPHASQRIGTASIQGRRSSSSWSRPRDGALPRARPASRSRSGARRRTGRTAAAARSSGGARCSSRPCCAASRPCACPCTRASTRRWRSRRAAAAGPRRRAMNQSSESRKISGVWQRQHYG